MHDTPVMDRFWAKVEKTEGCWLWTACRNERGYGKVGIAGRNYYAHRLAYEFVVGPIPKGVSLKRDSSCSTLCVNPHHHTPVLGSAALRKSWKTHCPQGHAYDDTNTRWYRGHRYCRACMPAHKARFIQKHGLKWA